MVVFTLVITRKGVIFMDKFYEKKNLGMPVIMLIVLSYFIGYSLTRSLSGTLLIAVLFAGAVFSLQFDERVKNAVKHSYIFATYFYLIGFVFDILKSFTAMFYSGRIPTLSSLTDVFYGYGIVSRALTFIHTYGLIVVDIAVVVIFGLFILMSLLNKDINLMFVKKTMGDAPSKAKRQPAPSPQAPPVNQQPVPTPQAQPVNQQPVPAPQAQPVQKVSGTCPSCGKVNNANAKFCAACGSKL